VNGHPIRGGRRASGILDRGSEPKGLGGIGLATPHRVGSFVGLRRADRGGGTTPTDSSFGTSDKALEASSEPVAAHERLRFAEFVLDRLSNGRCRARVGLTWRGSEQFAGQCEGLASQAGELRCAAQACVNALGQAVAGGMTFELLGVKAVRAFDATVVIVSLATLGEQGAQRVVGSYLTDSDPARGAALAVLNATNRMLGNRLFMR
jgi:hypothetical protein